MDWERKRQFKNHSSSAFSYWESGKYYHHHFVQFQSKMKLQSRNRSTFRQIILRWLLLNGAMTIKHPLSHRVTTFEDFKTEKRVAGKSLETTRSVSKVQCAFKCSKDLSCLSFNFCQSETCELNDRDVYSVGSRLETDETCIYQGMMRGAKPECGAGGLGSFSFCPSSHKAKSNRKYNAILTQKNLVFFHFSDAKWPLSLYSKVASSNSCNFDTFVTFFKTILRLGKTKKKLQNWIFVEEKTKSNMLNGANGTTLLRLTLQMSGKKLQLENAIWHRMVATNYALKLKPKI